MTRQNEEWTDEQTIKQQEFASGYWDESAAQSENPTERATNDGSELATDECQHTHAQTAASETTLYADGGVPDSWGASYNPNERLADDRTRREKYTTLWRYNAGHDSHRANGRSREECHKSDESATYKKRLTETVCNRANLGQTATDRATDLASNNQPPRFNFIGGVRLWILACIVVAAEQHGEMGRLDNVYPKELGDDWDVGVADLGDAIDAVEDGV